MIDQDRFNRVAIDWDLDTLRNTIPDPDGLIVDPIDGETIRYAGIVADAFPPGTPRPKVVPMTRGRVQFEWYCGPKWLELEIDKSGRTTYLSFDMSRGREVAGELGAADAERIRDLIRWLVGDGSEECFVHQV